MSYVENLEKRIFELEDILNISYNTYIVNIYLKEKEREFPFIGPLNKNPIFKLNKTKQIVFMSHDFERSLKVAVDCLHFSYHLVTICKHCKSEHDEYLLSNEIYIDPINNEVVYNSSNIDTLFLNNKIKELLKEKHNDVMCD